MSSSTDKKIILLGPVSFYHLKWKNKELLLFGDTHVDLQNSYDYDLIKFIKLIAEKTAEKYKCVDFYHELPFQKDYQKNVIEFNSDNKLIDFIRNTFNLNSVYNTNIDKYKYFRVHGWELSQYTSFVEKNDSFLGVIDNYTTKVFNPIVETIYNFYCNNKDSSFDDAFRQILVKYGKENKKNFDFDNEKFLSLLIHKQLENLNETYFKKQQLLDYFKKIYPSDTRLAVLETYSISRMFRIFPKKEDRGNKCDATEPDNVIYFGGKAHLLNVLNFLKEVSKEELQILYETTGKYITKTFYDNVKRHNVTERMNEQQIWFPLKNYFNLFDNPIEEIKNMNRYESFIIEPEEDFSAFPSAFPPAFPPALPSPVSNSGLSTDAPSFIPTFAPPKTVYMLKASAPAFVPGKPFAPGGNYKKKYLKYKAKYMKLKSSS